MFQKRFLDDEVDLATRKHMIIVAWLIVVSVLLFMLMTQFGVIKVRHRRGIGSSIVSL